MLESDKGLLPPLFFFFFLSLIYDRKKKLKRLKFKSNHDTWEQQDTNDLQDIPDSFSPIKVHLIFTQ